MSGNDWMHPPQPSESSDKTGAEAKGRNLNVAGATLPRSAPQVQNEGNQEGAHTTEASSGVKKRPRELGRQANAYPRKRALKACQFCRLRKVKCNNARPTCGFCASSGVDCIYEDSTDMSSLDSASLLILDRLDLVLKRLDEKSSGQTPQVTQPTPSSITGSSNNTAPNPEADEDESLELRHALTIPPARGSPDAILTWPIFEGRYSPQYFSAELFKHELQEHVPQNNSGPKQQASWTIDEEAIPRLVELFLTRVHTKNPILDVSLIREYARRVSQEGLRWDAPSCLVLVVCALGRVAKPFTEVYELADTPQASVEAHRDHLGAAQPYYEAARKRLGLLPNSSIISTQCIFLSGVFEMYSTKPIRAWQSFSQACNTCYVYLKCRGTSREPGWDNAGKVRRLETSLYWTCYKSQTELRAELDVPDSNLLDLGLSYTLPPPPEPGCPALAENLDEFIISFPESPSLSRLDPLQEQAWFYYLTEISLQRMGNRIIHTLYACEPRGWNSSNVHEMIEIADSFETQLARWYASLPAPITFQDDNPNASNEAQFMTQARVLLLKSWLYRPFLYLLIHNQEPLTRETYESVRGYAQQALASMAHHIQCQSLRHRHHGAWYCARISLSGALCIIAAVKARSTLVDTLNGWQTVVLKAIEELHFWAPESPDLAKGESLLREFYTQLVTQ